MLGVGSSIVIGNIWRTAYSLLNTKAQSEQEDIAPTMKSSTEPTNSSPKAIKTRSKSKKWGWQPTVAEVRTGPRGLLPIPVRNVSCL